MEEPAEVWGRPYELPLANWSSSEGPAADVWAPAAGVPVEYEYASIDIFGACSLQACVPESSEEGQQQQLADYYYFSRSQHNCAAEVNIHGENMKQQVPDISDKQEQIVDMPNEEPKISNYSCAVCVCKQVSQEFEDHMGLIKEKIYKYPASLQGFRESDYIVPRIVAIGPYHHHREHLKQAEKVKHMAAIRCVIESGKLLEELYGVVVTAADHVRYCLGLYDKDVMEDESLNRFLRPNRMDIQHDVLLLENQIPWQVVEALTGFMELESSPQKFITSVSLRGTLQDHDHGDGDGSAEIIKVALNVDYKPAHLLDLLRYHLIGRKDDTSPKDTEKRSFFSMSAMELAKIGIKLKAKNTTELLDMCLEEGNLFADLSLAPVCLDPNRASYLLNMAAHELCTLESFTNASEEKSAVCSYLQLLAMLVYNEEDVNELRAKGILEGGGGLADEEVLAFFTKLQGRLRLGPCYNNVMKQIANYKEKRRPRVTKSYTWYYKYKSIIWQAVSIFVTLITVSGTVYGISQSTHK